MTWVHVLELGYLLGLALVPRIVSSRRESSATLAWLLAVVLLPFAGALFYFVVGAPTFRRRTRKKRAANAEVAPALRRLEDALRVDQAAHWAEGELEERHRTLMALAARVTDAPVLGGNELEVLDDGRAASRALEDAIAGARDHVHLEYYIFRPDETGQRVLKLLAERARAGVEVRLLYDGFGSLALREADVAELCAAGGRAAPFLPIGLWRRPFQFNFRNHRKIVVVDGKIAFTGGLNIGDEYSGRRRRYAWRDTHMRIRGPVVVSLQEVFAEDWYFATSEDLVDARYFPPPERAGEMVAQVIDSGPDRPYQPIHRILFTAITLAQDRIWLTTPYFVPDPSIVVALQAAALRGIDVRLLLPSYGDLPLVQLAGRSFYDELLEAGCRIFEYQPVMLHAKTMTVDGCWGTAGSANMDMRSFRLNFEVNLVVYGEAFARRLEDIFLRDLERAREILRDRTVGAWDRFVQGAARTLAPVL